MTSDLARSEDRLREAERMVGVGSWELVVATGEITYSAGLARLLELEEDQPLDKDAHLELVHPADRELVAGDRRAVRADGIDELRVPGGPAQRHHAHPVAARRGDHRCPTAAGSISAAPSSTSPPSARPTAGAWPPSTCSARASTRRPIGMSLADPVEGRCVRVNDAMCRHAGPLARRSSSGRRSLVESSPTRIWPLLRRAREDMLRGEIDSFTAEQRFLRGDGSILWGLLHWAPVRREDGSVEAFHSQLVDITDRKERESRLEHDVGRGAVARTGSATPWTRIASSSTPSRSSI